MAWEEFKRVYPNGIYPGGKVEISELTEDLECIKTFITTYARKMRTKREDVTWFFNNDVERNLVYDLIDTPGDPYPRSCLNVYGKKMVQDITTNSLIRNADGTRNLWENYYQEGELNNHDRFNYTGL